LSGKIDSQSQFEWIVDSGATHHICFLMDMFDNLRPSNMAINLPNGSQVKAGGIDTVRLNIDSPDTQTKISLVLRNVLFVPTCTKNLFSITRASRQGIDFDFSSFPGRVVLKKNNLLIASSPNQRNSLYIFHHQIGVG